MHILIIEDDKHVAGFLRRGLKGHANDGSAVFFLAASDNFDAIILGRMLFGDIDGLEILAALRAQKNEVSVLILSALAEVDERAKGLKTSGHDYLAKSLAFAELLAWVEALARRGKSAGAFTKLVVEDLALDLLSRDVKRAGPRSSNSRSSSACSNTSCASLAGR